MGDFNWGYASGIVGRDGERERDWMQVLVFLWECGGYNPTVVSFISFFSALRYTVIIYDGRA